MFHQALDPAEEVDPNNAASKGCSIYLQPPERRSGRLLPRKFKEAFAKSAKASNAGGKHGAIALYNIHLNIDVCAPRIQVGIIRCFVEARFRVERSTIRGHLEKGACSDMP
jgi:hypothetical protein